MVIQSKLIFFEMAIFMGQHRFKKTKLKWGQYRWIFKKHFREEYRQRQKRETLRIRVYFLVVSKDPRFQIYLCKFLI